MDRNAISQAVAKVIAYKNVGKEREAYEWFARLATLLGYEKEIKSVHLYQDTRVVDGYDRSMMGDRFNGE